MSKKIVPGEWQTEVNAFGGVQRYRMIGNVKEYEMMVSVDGIEIPQSQLEDYHRRKKAQADARRAAPQPPPPKHCPFSFSGIPGNCRKEKCALYDGEACALAQLAESAARDTSGRKCPFNPYQCDAQCALYKTGCTLTALKTKGSKNHE